MGQPERACVLVRVEWIAAALTLLSTSNRHTNAMQHSTPGMLCQWHPYYSTRSATPKQAGTQKRLGPMEAVLLSRVFTRPAERVLRETTAQLHPFPTSWGRGCIRRISIRTNAWCKAEHRHFTQGAACFIFVKSVIGGARISLFCDCL